MDVEQREKMHRGLFVAHMRSIINGWFDNIKDYINSVPPLFQKEEARLSNVITEKSKKYELEGDEWFCIEYDQFKDSFRSIHTNSLFISLWSEFDSSLMFICRNLMHEKNRTNDVKICEPMWRSGSNLDNIKEFLKNEIDIYFPWDSNPWSKIKQINSIRNAIVHNNGWLFLETNGKKNKNNQNIKLYIQEKEKLCLKQTILLIDDKIKLIDNFLGEIIITMEGFHYELIKSISGWNKI